MCLYWPGNHKWVHTGHNKQLEILTWLFFLLLICGSLIKLNDSDAFLCAGWRGEAVRLDLQAHQNSHCSRGNSSKSICAWSWFWKNCFAISPMAIFLFTGSQSRWGITGELRPLERGVSTPELMFNNEFMPEYLFQNFQAREAEWAPVGSSGWLSVPVRPAVILHLIISTWKNKNCFDCKRNFPQEQQEANRGAQTCLS